MQVIILVNFVCENYMEKGEGEKGKGKREKVKGKR
jgi:hypothetical protein